MSEMVCGGGYSRQARGLDLVKIGKLNHSHMTYRKLLMKKDQHLGDTGNNKLINKCFHNNRVLFTRNLHFF